MIVSVPRPRSAVAISRLSRRAEEPTDEHLDLLRIQNPPDERLPAAHDLYFVKQEGDLAPVSESWEAHEVLLEHPRELPGLHTAEPLVLEIEIHTLSGGHPRPADLASTV